MLKFLATIAAILWIVVGMAELVSLAPAVSNHPPKTNNEGDLNGRCGTENNPSIVRIIICKIGETIDAFHDDITAASTVIIAILTVILGCFTISLARSTKRAADSSTLASTALLATERGTIVEVIRFIDASAPYWGANTFNKSPTMSAREVDVGFALYFRNYGKTPASIYDISLDIIISDDVPKIIFSIDDAFVLKKPTLARGEHSAEIEVKRSFIISFIISRSLVERSKSVYLIGTVDYVDVFGVRWKREFIWEYSRRLGACLLRYEQTQQENKIATFDRKPDPPPRNIPKMGKILTGGREDSVN